MSYMELLHLTFVGNGKPNAVVEFGQKVTVIYGASDTGKSFVVEAIDFMLGGSKLKEIPEARGYSQILLGVKFSDGEVVTLSRAPEGGDFGVYDGDIRTAPSAAPTFTLSTKHNAKSEKNISRFLLRKVGLHNYRVRKNVQNETQSLSFRNIAHLCVVSETQMQAQTPPALTGQHVSRTAEKSTLKALITGQDDSALIAAASPVEKSVSKGKIELLESLIEDLSRQLPPGSTLMELLAQVERIDESIASQTESLETVLASRTEIFQKRTTLAALQAKTKQRLGEISDLLSRFGLLREQYESDLGRLEMVREAGSLLGFFRSGKCVFCGAEPAHQEPGHTVEESTAIADSVSAEINKTNQLLNDLLLTIEDLSLQRRDAIIAVEESESQVRAIEQRAAELDRQLAPIRQDIADLVRARTGAEQKLAIHQQIEHLRQVRDEMPTEKSPSKAASGTVDVEYLDSFTDLVGDILQDWEVPGSDDVSFDVDTADLLVNGRPRATRGKGVRAIQHAAFTVALAEHCRRQALPHPGLIVLDSPVVTFRGPDSDADDTEATVSESVAHNMYRYLGESFSSQVIVVENVDPPAVQSIKAHRFTGAAGKGRSGFFSV
jgi:hypothetical protein